VLVDFGNGGGAMYAAIGGHDDITADTSVSLTGCNFSTNTAGGELMCILFTFGDVCMIALAAL
jgi:hypothetical protein